MNNTFQETEEPAPKPEDIDGIVTMTIMSSKMTGLNGDGIEVDMEYLAKSYPIKSGMAYKVPIYRVKLTSTARPSDERWGCVLRFLPVKEDTNAVPFMAGLKDAQSFLEPTYDPTYSPHNIPNLDPGAFLLYGDFMVHAGPSAVTEYGSGGKGCISVIDFNKFKTDIVYMCGRHPSDLPDKTMSYLCKQKRVNIVIEGATKPPIIAIKPPSFIEDKF